MSQNKSSDTTVKAWDLPFVEEPVKQKQGTNALNKKPEWKYEPPEPEPEIKLPTAADIDAIRQAAYEEGFEQGKTEGFEEGLQEGQKQGHEEGLLSGHAEGLEQGVTEGQQDIQQQLDTWNNINQQFTDPLSTLEDEVENELVQLAVGLARAVIKTEIASNPEVVKAALRAGIKALPVQEKHYNIYLNPDDLDTVKQQLLDENMQQDRWQLHEAPHLSAGGCELVTQNNSVDVTLERRIKDVIETFLFEHGLPNNDC